MTRTLCTLVVSGLLVTACTADSGTIGLEARADLEVSPSRVDFGTVEEGEAEVTVRNPNPNAFEIEARLSATPAFQIAGAATVVIDPEAEHVFTLRYMPPTTGTYEAELEVGIVGTSVVRTVALEGRTEAPTPPALRVLPTRVVFGEVVVRDLGTRTVDVQSLSDEASMVTVVGLENAAPCPAATDDEDFCIELADDALPPEGTFLLPPGETRTLEVRFTPSRVAMVEARFGVDTCPDPACRVPVTARGIGVDGGIQCTPDVVAIEPVPPGRCVDRVVSCENRSVGPRRILDWALRNDSEELSVAPPMTVSIAPGEAASVEVTYCPTDIGRDDATLQISTDGPDDESLIEVPIRAEGGGPGIELLGETVDFGDVSLLVPARRSIRIINTESSPLEISEIDVLGDVFRVEEAAPLFVRTGDVLEIEVIFEPTEAIAYQGQVVLQTNDGSRPEVAVGLLGSGVNAAPCNLQVVPSAINFGQVPVMHGRELGVELRNPGVSTCLVTGPVRFAPGSRGPFTIVDGDVRSLYIGPSRSHVVRVGYRPETPARHPTTLQIGVADPNRPRVDVPVEGTASLQTVLVSPDRLDFGLYAPGCPAQTKTLRIYNPNGRGIETLSDVRVAADAPAGIYSVSGFGTGPFAIGAGDFREVTVSFTPDRPGEFASSVEVTTGPVGSPVSHRVAVFGEAATPSVRRDEFTQIASREADILFVIDFTGCMGQEIVGVQSNFRALNRVAEAESLDYHIGITETGVNPTVGSEGKLFHALPDRRNRFGGPLENRIVSRSTQPDPQSVFETNVLGRTEYGGSFSDEAGLAAMYLALSPTLLTGYNQGFYRPDALLSVVILSDEEDGSGFLTAVPNSPSPHVDFFVDYLRSLKGVDRPLDATASVIAGDVPMGCQGPGGSARETPRYVELADKSGGAFESICSSDYESIMSRLSDTVFGLRRRFPLTASPANDSLQVFVDGTSVPATASDGTPQWRFVGSPPAVEFFPFATPSPGSEISLRYVAACP